MYLDLAAKTNRPVTASWQLVFSVKALAAAMGLAERGNTLGIENVVEPTAFYKFREFCLSH
jgi:hypothetical protein